MEVVWGARHDVGNALPHGGSIRQQSLSFRPLKNVKETGRRDDKTNATGHALVAGADAFARFDEAL